MKNNSNNLTRLYANGFLYFLEEEKINLQKIVQDCETLQVLLKELPDFLLILRQISNQAKAELFMEITKKSISKVWNGFFFVLRDDQSLPLLPEILFHLQSSIEKKIGIKRGQVFSVINLKSEQIKTLNKIFQKLLKQKIFLENKLDLQLIGGLKVTIENRSWDNSISQKLNKLRQELLN